MAIRFLLASALLICTSANVFSQDDVFADTVLLDRKILTMDASERIVTAVAIREGRVLAAGSDRGTMRFVGAQTKTVRLDGKTVIPGIIAAHCHAVGVARNALDQPHVELLTIAEVYGTDWAARFIGLGDWVLGGVPVAIAGDHMMGLDPNHAMNAYNPFLTQQVSVTRRNRDGDVYGDHQRISRLEARRCLTTNPAHLAFEEETKGSLESGKLADLAILDRDNLTCPANEIAEIGVLKTMLNGRFVYHVPE